MGLSCPESFYSFLHSYVSSVNELSSFSLDVNSPPSTILPSMSSSTLRPSLAGGLNLNASTIIGTEVMSDALPSDSDHPQEMIWTDVS